MSTDAKKQNSELDSSTLRFVGAHPPVFSADQARHISNQHFGIDGTFEPLWGERDQNFKITSADHAGYVLKISNDREDSNVIDAQIKALQHLTVTAPSLSVPRVKSLLSGQFFGQVAGKDNASHLVHMVSLLKGVTLSDVAFDQGTLFAAGAQAGEAAVGLRGFFHAATGQEMFWDIRRLGAYAPYISHITDAALRRTVKDFVASFCVDILPSLSELRSQVIHYDTNASNVLVDPENPRQVTGLIDFGDMIHGSIAQDVAVAAAELARPGMHNLEDIIAVVRGYDKTFPLEDVEIDLIYDLMVARNIQGILIGITRKLNGVISEEDVDYTDLYGASLDTLLVIGHDKIVRKLRTACRFPEYCPPIDLPPGTNQAHTDSLIKRRRKVLGTALQISYDSPLHIVRGEGVWLFDVDGRPYLDCYNNVPHVGHCHPHVVKTLSRQAGALNTNVRYLFETIVDYAERIGDLMPSDLGACLFVNSGSEANDIALRMAKECSGQDGALIVEDAYHGITHEIYALSPAAEWGVVDGNGNNHTSARRADIETLEAPDTFRGRFGAGDPDAGAKYAADADRAIATLKKAGHPVGAFMVDSAFSSNGILDVPSGYLAGVTKRVRAAGGMIIGDEVQSGFGRTGDNMWGFQTQGFVPDIVTLGKPIGNGLAIGVVVTTPAILERFTKAQGFFSTFGGNPVACAAATAVLDVMENENLLENARLTGTYLREGLRAVSMGKDNIGQVRGNGLFIGVDVVTDTDTMAPDAAETSRIKNYLRNNGVLVGTDGIGENVLKIRPPLVFQRGHADQLIETFENALR